MLALTASSTAGRDPEPSSGLQQALDGRPDAVDDGPQPRAVGLARPGQRLERRLDGPAAAVPEHHAPLHPEPLDGELHAADLRWGARCFPPPG